MATTYVWRPDFYFVNFLKVYVPYGLEPGQIRPAKSGITMQQVKVVKFDVC